ncbi:DNA glycosylase [Candidatus Atribacteria bacterium HGW-Atribacteria-1]|nr:MAG: DNA glycosylase [Candidatus Atribacteria bacterium HGW-Atribacteria-1]
MKNKLLKDIPSVKDILVFRNKIIRWFNKNGRDYPWRETRDPFKVLIAEMMLRRTKADQVKQVYEQLFTEYPDVEAVANAEDKKLEQILYPLGLKWRTPAFGSVAREVRERYQCKIPETREELTTLSGVGEYVAGAVLSIAYNKKEWIVDSNIVRLFRRYFGIKTSKEGRRDKHVIEVAKIYASVRNPRKANLAILDFTALICIPGKPDCEKCPLRRNCHYVCSQS